MWLVLLAAWQVPLEFTELVNSLWRELFSCLLFMSPTEESESDRRKAGLIGPSGCRDEREHLTPLPCLASARGFYRQHDYLSAVTFRGWK